MALPSRASLDDWSSEIAEDAVTEMRGEITIIAPQSDDNTDYDPEADSGGTADSTVLIDPRPARVLRLRAPSDATGAAQWGTKTAVRVQIEIRDTDPLIPAGSILKVLDGHKDKALEAYTYEVTRAVNSTQAPLRTIDAVSEMGPKA